MSANPRNLITLGGSDMKGLALIPPPLQIPADQHRPGITFRRTDLVGSIGTQPPTLSEGRGQPWLNVVFGKPPDRFRF